MITALTAMVWTFAKRECTKPFQMKLYDIFLYMFTTIISLSIDVGLAYIVIQVAY